MNNKELEQKLVQAIESTKENQWEKIKTSAANVDYTIREIPVEPKPNYFYRKVLVGALSVLLLMFGFTYYRSRVLSYVDAKIYIDVNPSVEIEINQNDKVIDVIPINEDGKTIIGNMNFKDSDLEVTVNALIGSMLRNGYLSELKNSVLVSVDATKQERALSLEEKLTSEINQVLSESELQGAILSQSIDDKSIQEKAETYHISTGKAKLIEEITKDSYHTFEELVDLPINDLNLIYKNKTNVNAQGEASQKGYIGEEAAIEKALAHVNANRNDVSRIEVDLDYENGRMVYELEFFYQNTSYEIEVDAISGEIAKYEYEARRENNTEVTPQVTPTYVPQSTSITQAPSNNATITVEEAINLAMNHAGVNKNDAYDIDAEYEREGYYDVDFKANGYEYNYDVDASNGSILRSKKEIDD